jgi:hypothetical protein
MRRICLVSLFLLVVFVFTKGIIYGGEDMLYAKDDLSGLKMSYRIEGAYSPYKYIQIDISGTGEGKLSYSIYKEFTGANKEKERTTVFKVEKSIIEKLAGLYRDADFLNLTLKDLNKDKIQVTDVGTTTLTYSYAGKERKLSYGYVENSPLKELLKVYKRLTKRYLPTIDRTKNRY